MTDRSKPSQFYKKKTTKAGSSVRIPRRHDMSQVRKTRQNISIRGLNMEGHITQIHNSQLIHL